MHISVEKREIFRDSVKPQFTSNECMSISWQHGAVSKAVSDTFVSKTWCTSCIYRNTQYVPSSISGEKKLYFAVSSAVTSASGSETPELVTLELLPRCSLQSTFFGYDRIFTASRFGPRLALVAAEVQNLLAAQEIGAGLRKSLSCVRTSSYRREKLHGEKCCSIAQRFAR